jgi:protein TorT
MQGRLSINQAVRVLEGRPFLRHAGPAIRLLQKDTVTAQILGESLAPPTFHSTFRVAAPGD